MLLKLLKDQKAFPRFWLYRIYVIFLIKLIKKTQGLGIISARINSKATNFQAYGLVMHTTFAVTTDGLLPIGLLDQKISSRPPIAEEVNELRKRSHGKALPIEEKESIRWLESLKNPTTNLH